MPLLNLVSAHNSPRYWNVPTICTVFVHLFTIWICIGYWKPIHIHIETANRLLILKHLSGAPIRVTYHEFSSLIKTPFDTGYASHIETPIKRRLKVPGIRPPFKTLNTPYLLTHLFGEESCRISYNVFKHLLEQQYAANMGTVSEHICRAR